MLGSTLMHNGVMIARILTSHICFTLLSLAAANCKVL
jgi:hypothetical protein